MVSDHSASPSPAWEPAPSCRLRVFLFGPLLVFQRSPDLSWLPLPKHAWGKGRPARSVFKRLLLSPSRRLSRCTLQDDLWPSPDDALSLDKTLYNAINQLRRAIGKDLVLTIESSYALADPSLIWTDYDASQALLTAAEQRGRTTEAALPLLEQALGYMTRGELLEEEGGLWVHAARLHGQAMLRQCRRWLAQISARQGRLWLASEHFRALLQADPADEEALREWLHVLLQHGQEREARRCYEEVQALAAQQGETLPSWEQLRLVKPPADMVCLTQTEDATEEAQPGLLIPAAPGRQPGSLGLAASPDPALTTLPLPVGSPLWFVWQLRRVEALLIHFQERSQGRLDPTAWAELRRRLQEELAAVPPHEHDRDYTISRRQMLGALAALPLTTLTGVRNGLPPAEEVLPLCAAANTACWQLLNSQGIGIVQEILPRYLPLLERLAQPGTPQHSLAARLAAEANRIAGIAASHHQGDLRAKQLFSRKAVHLAALSGHAPAQIAALRDLSLAFYYDRLQVSSMLAHLEPATPLLAACPPVMQSSVLCLQATASAYLGREETALLLLGEAQERFESQGETETCTDFRFHEDNLMLWAGRVYL
ncbi:AfsR/SARP family transcriptional regulator, partial [Thermogemmatispora onikobensis]|uniref:AfsR/SARP family transcriptional regulator n=1 Tax=Thermogemmatispora onikobensis TaxID=732234 RepID=UPI00085337D3